MGIYPLKPLLSLHSCKEFQTIVTFVGQPDAIRWRLKNRINTTTPSTGLPEDVVEGL